MDWFYSNVWTPKKSAGYFNFGEDGDPDDQDDYHCDQDDDQDDQDLIAGRPQSVNSSFDSHTSHSLGGQGRDSSFNRS